jgi:hypothetical protein
MNKCSLALIDGRVQQLLVGCGYERAASNLSCPLQILLRRERDFQEEMEKCTYV